MMQFSYSEDLARVARRVIWFQEAEETLREPLRFLSYAMTYGDCEDLATLQAAGVTTADYKHVLENAPAGIFDPRSWAYWNVKFDRTPVPDLPKRIIPT